MGDGDSSLNIEIFGKYFDMQKIQFKIIIETVDPLTHCGTLRLRDYDLNRINLE